MVTAGCHPHEGHGYVEADGPCELSASAPTPADTEVQGTRRFVLPAGAFGEVDLDMEPGARVVATFEAVGAPVEWNVHSHDADGTVVIHDDGLELSGTIDFVAVEPDVYSLLWSGEGPVDATLCVGLFTAGEATPID
jgi:hypothetical protein